MLERMICRIDLAIDQQDLKEILHEIKNPNNGMTKDEKINAIVYLSRKL